MDTRNNVTAPKHNKSRKVPLSPALAAALAKLPKLGLWVIASTQEKRKGDRLGYRAMLEKLHAIYVDNDGDHCESASCERLFNFVFIGSVAADRQGFRVESSSKVCSRAPTSQARYA